METCSRVPVCFVEDTPDLEHSSLNNCALWNLLFNGLQVKQACLTVCPVGRGFCRSFTPNCMWVTLGAHSAPDSRSWFCLRSISQLSFAFLHLRCFQRRWACFTKLSWVYYRSVTWRVRFTLKRKCHERFIWIDPQLATMLLLYWRCFLSVRVEVYYPVKHCQAKQDLIKAGFVVDPFKKPLGKSTQDLARNYITSVS